MKKYYVLAATLLMTGTGAFAASPQVAAKVAEGCCALLACCGLPCC